MSAAATPSLRNPSTTPNPHRPISRNLIKSPLIHQRHHLVSLRLSIPPQRPTKIFFSGERSAPASDQLSLDAFLSVAEMICVGSPAMYSIGCLVGSLVPGGLKVFQVHPGSRVLVVQLVMLVGAVAIGGIIRRRQWQRMCRVDMGGSGVDLIARIEKVEEDVRSSGTIVRVLSRQLEKLGIRFRVTRKALKEPIAETAALAQKNSEATRALAMQEDILEKELGEIQKVLLAMQEQQQKQLELILAIGKAGRLFDTKRDATLEKSRTGPSDSIPEKEEVKPMESQTQRQGGANDRV